MDWQNYLWKITGGTHTYLKPLKPVSSIIKEEDIIVRTTTFLHKWLYTLRLWPKEETSTSTKKIHSTMHMLKSISIVRWWKKTLNNFNIILPWYNASSSSLWCKDRYRSSSQSCSARRSASDRPTHRFASWPPGCASYCFKSYKAPRPSYLHDKPTRQSASTNMDRPLIKHSTIHDKLWWSLWWIYMTWKKIQWKQIHYYSLLSSALLKYATNALHALMQTVTEVEFKTHSSHCQPCTPLQDVNRFLQSVSEPWQLRYNKEYGRFCK